MNCEDAPEMLQLRRQFAANDKISTAVKLALIDCIDLILKNHWHLTDDCQCFQRAQREADVPREMFVKPEYVA
jgi:hypothetical protein